MQNVWSIDADDIRTLEDFDEKILHKTPSIEVFLKVDKDTKFFVVATKGVGKTFLLTAKRRLYQEKNVKCLPQNSLRDMFIGNTIFNKSTISLLDNERHWSTLWATSILLAIFKSTNVELHEESQELKNIFYNPHFHAVSDFFQNILAHISQERVFFFSISNDYNSYLIPKARHIKTAIAIFLDKVDEYFNDHVSIRKFGKSKSIGELEPHIWFLSQIGLVDAIYDLARLNHHFKMFASIRKEAFERLRDAKLYRQYRGASIEPLYSKQDLKEMFIKYIKRADPASLANPKLIDTHPFSAFLGVSEFIHSSVEGQREDPFDYMYRHTLQRPRDLMALGERISFVRTDERTENKLKIEIDRECTRTAEEYISLEVEPYFRDMNVDELLRFFHTNILHRAEIKMLCSKYNGEDCDDISNCSECPATHIFCFLYKIGLIGYVVTEHTTGREVQKFLPPGSKTFDPDGILPMSSHYLVHPILYSRIQQLNQLFNADDHNIVGDQLAWNEIKDSFPEKESITQQVSKSEDQDFNRSPDELLEALTELVCDSDMFSLSDPPAETGDSRRDIQVAIDIIIGEEDALILDLGCGTGPLVQALSKLDEEQLGTLTYIGVNRGNLENIQRLINEKNLEDKFKRCSILAFENLDLLTIKADYVFIIDVLHHLCPAELERLVCTAIKCIKNYRQIFIIESKKERENDRFFWTSVDIKELFKGYSTLKVFAHESYYERGDVKVPLTIAAIKKIAGTVIGSEFKTRCFSIYKDKLEEFRQKRKKIQEGSQSYESNLEFARYMMIESGIVSDLDKAEKIWATT